MDKNDDDVVNKGHDKGHNVLIIDFEKTLLLNKYMKK
jgi:hypothetical protein